MRPCIAHLAMKVCKRGKRDALVWRGARHDGRHDVLGLCRGQATGTSDAQLCDQLLQLFLAQSAVAVAIQMPVATLV